MIQQLLRLLTRRRRNYAAREIAPDEIFLDARNLPEFDEHQFEGRLEKPVSPRSIKALGLVCCVVGLIFIARLWGLQIVDGQTYAAASEENRLAHSLIFSERGIIYDRNGVELAWNTLNDDDAFAEREYFEAPGLSHLLGFVSYPTRDAAGFFFREDVDGKDGVEEVFDHVLGGENGVTIIETNALGGILSQNTVRPPRDGNNITLTVDSRLQRVFYEEIQETAKISGFEGGAAAMIDIHTGEVIALTSFPEFSSHVVTNESNSETYKEYHADARAPFLNRAVSGLYTPGSIVKPFLAVAALEEEIIDPYKKILSTGELRIPNPYNPDEVSIFRDNRAHGWVNMRDAIAVSSNVYFYEVGGGFEDQRGLGIANIERYMSRFGFGAPTGMSLSGEGKGVIPNPKWKAEHFDGDIWRLGDTYHTSIGQYGFQVTPIQVVRATAALANGGILHTPWLSEDDPARDEKPVALDFEEAHLRVAREGMRQAVESGGVQGIRLPYVAVAAKTGTAEVGLSKSLINSWVTGFFPYENPKYAFVVLMEKGDPDIRRGAVVTMLQVFNWMRENAPEYLGLPPRESVTEE